jgi:hypothetical protein
MGSKNRIPRPKEAQQRLTEIVSELETGEYLYTNADKKYVGTATELLQSIYRAESLPVKIRLYAASKAVDIEPRPEVKLPLTEADKEENEREWQKLLEYFAAFAIRETVYQLNGQPAGDSGCPAWVPARVSVEVAAAQALLGVPITEVVPARQKVFWGGQSGHGTDTAPLRHQQPVVTPAYNGAASSQTVDVNNPQPNGAAIETLSPGNGGARVRFDRIMYGEPHKNFWLGSRQYSANEFGEIELDPDTPQAGIEELQAHGYRARR